MILHLQDFENLICGYCIGTDTKSRSNSIEGMRRRKLTPPLTTRLINSRNIWNFVLANLSCENEA